MRENSDVDKSAGNLVCTKCKHKHTVSAMIIWLSNKDKSRIFNSVPIKLNFQSNISALKQYNSLGIK